MAGLVLIDRITKETVGAGVLNFELRRSQNVRWQAIDVDKSAHASLKGQRPCVLWLTGLSAAGKSTIANVVDVSCTPWVVTPTCSTATTSGTASIRTSGSPMPTGSRTSAGSPRSPG